MREQASPKYTVTETLHERDGTAVYRAISSLDRRAVILKVFDPRRSGPAALDRQRREYEVGRALDLATVARPLVLDTHQGMPALVLEDWGGQPLDRVAACPMQTGTFLEIAVRVAAAVDDVHRRGVIHRDLKPENILVHPTTLEVKLADFGLATRLPRELKSARPPDQIEGSLPFMSPEQTGRMNRGVDSRTDLYSLGVTFYRLLTGRLPFEARDPLEWVHCHIARAPPAPSDVVPGLPEAISGIVTKLLAKMAEDRYQTAPGLRHDLERCLAQWRAGGRIDPFPLGERDAPDRLQIPERLYGREAELGALQRAFEGVVETGTTALVLVSGYSGIGKSSLVHELEEPIVRRRGLFLAGKFDRHQRQIPYSTIVHAFRQLVLDVLAEGEERLADWRARLGAALGVNAQLVVDMIPPLGLVLGLQPPVAELPPSDAQHRFRAVLRDFIGAFAREERPLALFLDDLQWADPASLALVEDLVTHPDVRFLLVVGAYRDNEVTPAHPLNSMLETARRAGARLSHIAVGPLSTEDLERFVADALRSPGPKAASLAALVAQKTGANPFFAIQFLTELHEEHLVERDPGTGGWRWDLARLRTRTFTENVVDLMAARLGRLSPETQEALKMLACLGNSTELDIAEAVLGRSEAEIEAVLWEALREGLLLRVDHTYRFLHDRVREAAYLLVEEKTRPAVHLSIGRRLLAHLQRKALEDRVFEVVSQLNRGIELVTDPGERDTLRGLDLLAGQKARASGAYASARSHLQLATALLPPDPWTTAYHEAFAIQLALAECEYLVGDFRHADEVLDALLRSAASELDRATVHLARMRLYQGAGRFDDALRTGLGALQQFGVSFPETAAEIAAAFETELRQAHENLAGRRPADLVDAPEIAAPDVRMILRLLVEIWVPSYNARPEAHRLHVIRAVNLCLVHGVTPESSVVYAAFALQLVGTSGEIGLASELVDAALRLAERFDDLRARAAVVNIHSVIDAWRRPIGASLPFIDDGFRAQREIGDLSRAAVSALLCAWTVVVESGGRLDEVLKTSERYVTFAEESRNETMRDALRHIRQLVPVLKGKTREPASFDDDGFSEAACRAAFERARFGAGLTVHRVLKQIAAFLYGRYEQAYEAAVEERSAPAPVSAFLYDATHHFLRGLTAAALHPGATAAAQGDLARVVAEELEHHRLWAESCPGNFLHRYALLSAEAARVEGRELEAEARYEQAIKSAHDNGFVHHEALANELASRFHRARGLELVADAYLREARACYASWGADGKVRQLDEEHPQLCERKLVAPTMTFAARTEQLDLLSVAKGAQTISGEIFLDKVVRTLLQVVLEQGGARRCCLLLAHDGHPSIEAEAVVEDNGVKATLLPSTPLGSASPLVPASLVHYVQRTRERVILDASGGVGKFSVDGYLARRRPRSVLCLPIVRQRAAVGVLYLENDLVSGAFTPERLVALELLATQAAISVESATLLAKELAAREAAEEARRRAAFLAEAGALLSESLDLNETLGRLARLCVQSLADWCVIDLLSGREIRRVGGAHADPAKEPLLRELQRRYPVRWDSRHPAAAVLRTGEPSLFPERSDEGVRGATEDDEHARLVGELGARTVMVVPLVARGETLGVISLASAAPGRLYGPTDLEMAQELARRAAIAVENARLYREAQDAIRLRDEFLSVASHELYTPITSLMLSLDTLHRARWTRRQLDDAAMNRSLDVVLRQGRRLMRLVGDLLGVSRIETGRLALRTGEVELGSLVREVVERFEPDLARAGCAITVRASTPVHGRWDGSRLDQVVTNLVSNAMKFGPGKPIEIALGTERGVARLVVVDRGIGIAAARLGRIFDRFERAAPVEHYGGLGLGLYISRRIVEAHGGSLRVESTPGAGSTFTVELPCSGPPDVASQGGGREE
jgi:predicted ATPase/signal transduction histidine kinase